MVVFNGESVASAFSLPLIRVPAGSACEGVLLSDRPLFLAVHFLGKSVVCPGSECPLCSGSGARLRGYLMVEVVSSPRPFVGLLEFSSCTWERSFSLAGLSGERVRLGSVVAVSRRRKNSPLVIEWLAQKSVSMSAAKAEHRTLCALAVLYSLPVPGPEEEVEHWSERCRSCAEGLVRGAMARGGR